jgi:competence protein ComEC
MAATVAAEIMLLPISAAVFGRVTIAGILLNVVAIPAMAVVEIGGLLTVVAGPVWPALGHVFAHIASLAAHVLVSSSGLIDWWPWLWWRVPNLSGGGVAFYYAAGSVLIFLRAFGAGRRVVLVIAGVMLGLVATRAALERWTSRPATLRVSVLDVGQGDAILVQLPQGQALLIDAGGSPGAYDIGTRVVTPSVWALGVRALTWLAVTHGDRDHVGGAYGVTEDLLPREIWEAIPVPANRELARVHDLASSRGIAWRAVRAGAELQIGSVRIDTLHPIEPDWERQKVRNDDSMVLRIHYGRVELLLTGDAGAEFEARLPSDLGDPPIRILKAGHHGSRTSTSDRLIDAMHPQVALISVGRGNAFGHPSPDVIERLRRAGVEIFRTDRDGAISVETDGVAARVVTALGRSWTLAVYGPS